jgi:UDP-3-O-acyl N-acetylglucosamine deacetylase
VTPNALSILPRRTLARPCTFSGITLFTGALGSFSIHPSARGILFRRVDLPGQPAIPATAAHIVPESRRTVLSANPSDKTAPTIQTVEHLLSALAGLGITDATIDLTGPEIPIADGSSLPFVEAILAAGIVPSASSTPNPVAIVTEPIVIEHGPACIEAHATDRPGLELTYKLEYPPGGPIPGQQASIFIPLGPPAPDYASQVAPARTFCLAAEAQQMRAMGLFAHLTPREMLVVGDRGPIDNAYLFDNEPARHKLLDLLGDLSLAARPIQARITATRTGHAHNHAMARALAGIVSA